MKDDSIMQELLLMASNDGNAVEVKRLLKKLRRKHKKENTLGSILDKIVDPIDGATPLHKASRQGHVGICGLLVAMGGANPNVVSTHDKSTPLHYATYYGTPRHVETVSFLLDHGASPTAKDEFGMTPLHHASQSGFDPMVQMLIEHSSSNNNLVDQQDKFKYTPLHFAAQMGRLETAKLLLDKGGAKIDMKNMDDHTPLALAVLDGDEHLAIIEFLLTKGADIKGAKKDGLLPIHLAAREGQTQTVQILLNHGADAKRLAWGHSSPLHLATVFSKLDTAKLLLDYGAELNPEKDYVEDLPELVTHSRNPWHNSRLELQEKLVQQEQEHQERLKQMAEKMDKVVDGKYNNHNNSSMKNHIQGQLHTAFNFFLLGVFLFVGMSYWRKQQVSMHLKASKGKQVAPHRNIIQQDNHDNGDKHKRDS